MAKQDYLPARESDLGPEARQEIASTVRLGYDAVKSKFLREVRRTGTCPVRMTHANVAALRAFRKPFRRWRPRSDDRGYYLSALRAWSVPRSVTFVKAGHDGVDIETQRGAEMTWTYLAFDSSSPYIDNRPPATAGQPEQRRYRLRYRDNDIPVGLFSDTLTVTVGP